MNIRKIHHVAYRCKARRSTRSLRGLTCARFVGWGPPDPNMAWAGRTLAEGD